MRKERRVTLVLGGGSARGIAHIGVLKVLESERIPIHAIIGTSIGGLVGAGYALGIPLSTLEEKALKFTWQKLFDPTIPKLSLLEGKKLDDAIRDITENKTFNDCKIPLAIVATDIENDEELVFTKGDLQQVIRGSCSWPGIFAPVTIDGRLVVDGGIKESVPTRIARSMDADYILAVDVGFCVRVGKITNIFQMMLQSFQIMGQELNSMQSGFADALIEVDLGDLDQAAFHRAKEAIQKGEEAAREKVDDIKKALKL